MNFCDVTTVICVFNKSKFLERCINSVLFQTLPSKKIICINDYSTDGSDKILEAYKIKYPSLFTVIHNQINLGLTSSRNIALQYVCTKYVAFLDGDDYWSTTKLEKQLVLLNAGADVVYNSYAWVQNGKIQYDRYCLPPALTGYETTEPLLEGNLISGSASAVICNYSKLAKVGYADHNLKKIANDFGEDWDMWLRLSTISNFNYSDEILTYLDDSGSFSSPPSDDDAIVQRFKSHFYIRSKYFLSFKSTTVTFQSNEYLDLLKRINIKRLGSLRDWMMNCNFEFSVEIINQTES